MMTEKNIARTGEAKKVYHVPLADIYETADLYSLKLEMPGIVKDNLNIVIDENELRITADAAAAENVKDLKYAEFYARNFSRTFRIGNDIDRNKVDAKLENGILTLVLHKSEEVKPRKIAINQLN